MTYGTNPPAISKTAFECPHCGAYTSQQWHKLFVTSLGKGGTPNIPDGTHRERIVADTALSEATKRDYLRWVDGMNSGLAFFGSDSSDYSRSELDNLFVSSCFVCEKLAVWQHTKLVFPQIRTGPMPHKETPEVILRDFEEARTILASSPRGAAALLRLCIQKLCDDLGESGKTIDQAIASLVARGLNPVVADALDTVRVIGNEAVHPGQIDLRDDHATASKLFDLVNFIIDRMISDQKQVAALFATLPESKRKAIEARNAKVKALPAPEG